MEVQQYITSRGGSNSRLLSLNLEKKLNSKVDPAFYNTPKEIYIKEVNAL